MATSIDQLERNVLRASLRWHNYRERYMPLRRLKTYPNHDDRGNVICSAA